MLRQGLLDEFSGACREPNLGIFREEDAVVARHVPKREREAWRKGFG